MPNEIPFLQMRYHFFIGVIGDAFILDLGVEVGVGVGVGVGV